METSQYDQDSPASHTQEVLKLKDFVNSFFKTPKLEASIIVQPQNQVANEMSQLAIITNKKQHHQNNFLIHLEDPKNKINFQQWENTNHLKKLLDLQQQNPNLEPQLRLIDLINENFGVFVEAMTVPTYFNKVNYGRLHFYGDEIISFLIILELILTLDKNQRKGELDFYRSIAVSNMNFAIINKEYQIYKYIIQDQSKNFNDIIPFSFQTSDRNDQINQSQERSKNNFNQHHQMQAPQLNEISHKQLADIIGSTTGCISLVGGLYSTHDYLLKLGILKQPLEKCDEELNQLLKHTNDKMVQAHHQQLRRLQKILKYNFKNPTLLLYAVIHKSFKVLHNSKQENSLCQVDDFERLEYLGGSIINFLISQHYFHTTREEPEKYRPKYLYKMKTSIVSNVFLSLVVIHFDIHQFIIYNEQSEQFKQQFDKYVGASKNFLFSKQDKPNEEKKDDIETDVIDLDYLYEHSLMILGDVMKSIVGAVFSDSKSISEAKRVLFGLFSPFMQIYGNHKELNSLQDHPIIQTLELWNSNASTKALKLYHQLEKRQDGMVGFKGFIQNVEVIRIKLTKEQKNKIRKFYKIFQDLIQEFIDCLDSKYKNQSIDEIIVLREVKKFRKLYRSQLLDKFKQSGNITKSIKHDSQLNY